MTWLIAKKCLSHNLSLSNLVFSAFVTSPNMSYQCCFNLNNTTSALVEQKLLIITTRMISLPGFSWIRVSQTLSSVWCFLCHWLSFCLFFFLPMHWVFFLFPITAFGYPFGIFKLPLWWKVQFKICRKDAFFNNSKMILINLWTWVSTQFDSCLFSHCFLNKHNIIARNM